MAYANEHRTYHGYKDGSYFFPNDGQEQDRLDFQHQLFNFMLENRLYLAPVNATPEQVLDIATGTGIWAIEFATQNPSSHVIGTDLSLIQPARERLPLNVDFIREDSENDEWVFKKPFDLIHLRLTFSCFNDPRTVIKKSFDNLRPGGWLEWHDGSFVLGDFDNTLQGTNVQKWSQLLTEGARLGGRDIDVAKNYPTWLRQAGFVDVFEMMIPVPGNPWAKEPKFKQAGLWQMTNVQDGLEGFSSRLLKLAGLSQEQTEELLKVVSVELRDPNIHFYWPLYVVFGRKPS